MVTLPHCTTPLTLQEFKARPPKSRALIDRFAVAHLASCVVNLILPTQQLSTEQIKTPLTLFLCVIGKTRSSNNERTNMPRHPSTRRARTSATKQAHSQPRHQVKRDMVRVCSHAAIQTTEIPFRRIDRKANRRTYAAARFVLLMGGRDRSSQSACMPRRDGPLRSRLVRGYPYQNERSDAAAAW
jgi:hypothetical protein